MERKRHKIKQLANTTTLQIKTIQWWAKFMGGIWLDLWSTTLRILMLNSSALGLGDEDNSVLAEIKTIAH